MESARKGKIARASKDIVGKPVMNFEGESIGDVKELMIDREQGQVTYAVMSFGGFLGMGDKLFAVPWVSLKYDGSKDAFVMKVDKELLKNAPGFDKSDWPGMSDPTRQSAVYRYYDEIDYYESGRL